MPLCLDCLRALPYEIASKCDGSHCTDSSSNPDAPVAPVAPVSSWASVASQAPVAPEGSWASIASQAPVAPVAPQAPVVFRITSASKASAASLSEAKSDSPKRPCFNKFGLKGLPANSCPYPDDKCFNSHDPSSVKDCLYSNNCRNRNACTFRHPSLCLPCPPQDKTLKKKKVVSSEFEAPIPFNNGYECLSIDEDDDQPVVESASLPVVESASLPVVESASLPVVESFQPVVESASLPVVESASLPVVESASLPVVESFQPVVESFQPVVESFQPVESALLPTTASDEVDESDETDEVKTLGVSSLNLNLNQDFDSLSITDLLDVGNQLIQIQDKLIEAFYFKMCYSSKNDLKSIHGLDHLGWADADNETCEEIGSADINKIVKILRNHRSNLTIDSKLESASVRASSPVNIGYGAPTVSMSM